MSKPASIYSNTSRQRVIEAGGTRLSGILQPEPAAALARLLASGQHGSNKMAVISAALLALDATAQERLTADRQALGIAPPASIAGTNDGMSALSD